VAKTIIENGVRVYENHFCKHCGERIPWKKTQERKGIPEYIWGHHPTPTKQKGQHPKTEFPLGHKLNCGKHNPMFDVHRFGESSPNWKGGISLTRKRLAYPKSF
jgi:hypothetical protein